MRSGDREEISNKVSLSSCSADESVAVPVGAREEDEITLSLA